MWRRYVKDGLMVLFVISIILIFYAMSFLQKNEPLKGFLIFVLACNIGMISIVISFYWHKRGIHTTILGSILSIIVFIAGIIVLWRTW